IPLPLVTNIKKKQSCRWGVLAKANLSTFSSTLPISKCSASGLRRITSMVYMGRPFFGDIQNCGFQVIFQSSQISATNYLGPSPEYSLASIPLTLCLRTGSVYFAQRRAYGTGWRKVPFGVFCHSQKIVSYATAFLLSWIDCVFFTASCQRAGA